MSKLKLVVYIVCIVFLVGCTREGQRTPVEDLALVSSIAIDNVDEIEMKITVSIPQPMGESPVLTEHYSATADMIQEALVSISSEADKMIVLNQLRTILINEEFARSGKLTKAIEHFYRDATIGSKVRLVIVKGQAGDILKADYPENEHLDAYLNDLFQPKLHISFSPFTTIHDFITTQTSPIYHSMIPYMEKTEKSLKVTSVALFNDKEMVQTINTKQSLLIQALLGENKLAPIPIKLNDNDQNERIYLEKIKNKIKVKSNKNIDNPKLDITLLMEGVLIEYKGERNLDKVEERKRLEKEINDHLENEIESLIEKLKELKIDPVGFSEYFRMHYKGEWTDELTQKIIESIEHNVKVDFKILNTGTMK